MVAFGNFTTAVKISKKLEIAGLAEGAKKCAILCEKKKNDETGMRLTVCVGTVEILLVWGMWPTASR